MLKFQRLGVKNETLKPGGLTKLMEEVQTTAKATDVKNRLAPSELARIPQLYSNLDYKQPIPTLENDRVYKTVNGDEYLGSDIKAITMLMYTKPRTAYCDFKKERTSQVACPSANGATPLPLLGFKRHQNLPYSYWQKKALSLVYMKEVRIDEEKKYILTYADNCTTEDIFNIDLLLGNTYASTVYDSKTDSIVMRKEYGLIVLSAHTFSQYRPTKLGIDHLREHGFGNYKGNVFTSYGTSHIDYKGSYSIITDLYNSCTTPMRLLLAQRWAWYGNHRTPDMITDFQDWDNLTTSVDTLSKSIHVEVKHGVDDLSLDSPKPSKVFGL